LRRYRPNSESNREEGLIIILVAVFLLFVVGAMAALSIDVVTFYTARSEAQLAADAIALAGARVLANSGMTSSTDPTLTSNAVLLATNMANEVAQQNLVGGSAPTVTVSVSTAIQGNPHVTVHVSRNDLPTFFARIWGSKTVTVGASATAEAYNPSGLSSSSNPASPVAPSCVKPWLLPNIDPNNSPNPIFGTASGSIQDSALLGWDSPPATRLHALCAATPALCPPATPQAWQYYQGAESSFPHPTKALPACTLTSNFQMSIAGCVQTPIACGSFVNINTAQDLSLDPDTASAVDCLANLSNDEGDRINPALLPPSPFEFRAGDDNPLVQAGVLASRARIMVSDSLVTVPVFDNSTWGSTPPASVQVIGFVQLFLQPNGFHVPTSGANPNQISTKVMNMVGCGTNSSGTPVYGNGASAVPVRLITPP